MKVILVCMGNFQKYILDNIKNLMLFNNHDIEVICDTNFFSYFVNLNVKLVDAKTIDTSYFEQKFKLNKQFRNGFWYYCSLRLFILYEYIKKHNLVNCVHIENDVMIYENFDKINFNNVNKLCVPFDNNYRAIPSIMYIPNYNSLEWLIDNYNFNMNDMVNIGRMNDDLVEKLPIYINIYTDNRKSLVENFDKYNVIFDAAAIGQYLGGVDERNINGDTRGFINNDSYVKYNENSFFWIKSENNLLFRPYIKISEKYIQIINLHIHSKKLINFMANDPLETKFIIKK